jgi:glycerol-3-phosphate acyltransferase PlsY
MLPRVIALLIGYGFGLFQTAYLYGRVHGVDIRTVGSGNAGTTNTLRTFGKKAGYIVFAGDCLKAILAVLVVWLIFHNRCPEIERTLRLYAGLGAVLGHNYPFYMNFKGGKGVACTAGLGIAFSWQIFLVGLILFALSLALVHYVSLGSLFVGLTLLFGTIIAGSIGFFGMTRPHLMELYILAAIISGQLFYRHRENIVRLIKGQERKTYFFTKGKNS